MTKGIFRSFLIIYFIWIFEYVSLAVKSVGYSSVRTEGSRTFIWPSSLVTHLSALHSLVKVQRVLSLIGPSHVSIIPVAFTAQFTQLCAHRRRRFKVKMASKILLRVCRLSLMRRQNVFMKTPQRAMAGKGTRHSRIIKKHEKLLIFMHAHK